MDPGPKDDRGWCNPSQATITWEEVVKRGWQHKCPPYWREAVAKALDQHVEDLHREEMEERLARSQNLVSGMTTEQKRAWLENRRLKVHNQQM